MNAQLLFDKLPLMCHNIGKCRKRTLRTPAVEYTVIGIQLLKFFHHPNLMREASRIKEKLL